LGLGWGLITVVRPHLVHTVFSNAQGGHLNGRIARHQQLSRAAGPLAVAWTASHIGYAAVFLLIAVSFLVVAVLLSALSTGNAGGMQQEAA
jgi:cbb3-type cytochrome oxidase subunit 3